MKEVVRPIPHSELTSRQSPSRLESGAIFMANDYVENNKEGKGPATVATPKWESKKAALQSMWDDHLGDQGYTDAERKDPATRRVIDLISEKKVAPEKKTERMIREEAAINAMLDDTARVEEAGKILGRELGKEERNILLAAHKIGRGQVGKDGRPAGIGNYTREQLAEKIEKLKEKFPREEWKKLMEYGFAGDPVVPPDTAGGEFNPADFAQDPVFAPLARKFDSLWREGLLTEDMLNAIAGQIAEQVDSPAKQNFLAGIKTARAKLEQYEREARDRQEKAYKKEQKKERFNYFRILAGDLEKIDINPMAWLDEEFDRLNRLASQGQEADSPAAQIVQERINEAYLHIIYRFKDDPKLISEFGKNFTHRLNLLFMSTAIGQRNMEGIQGMSRRLKAQGLMEGLAMENRKASAMFSRLDELMEDLRLTSEEKHLVPETISTIQNKLVEEQFELAKNNIGTFSLNEIRAEEEKRRRDILRRIEEDNEDLEMPSELSEADLMNRLHAEIVRAVRTAGFVHKISQRESVIVARGHHLQGTDAYFSDPGGAFNVFNLEDLAIGKFDIFNAHDDEFLRQMKLYIANDWYTEKGIDPNSLPEHVREDLGRRLVRDLFVVPDYFSSGWRIKGMRQQLEKVMRYKTAVGVINSNDPFAQAAKERVRNEHPDWSEKQIKEAATRYLFVTLTENRSLKERVSNMGLFLQLKAAGKAERRNVWQKIAKYRPEEIVRLFADRSPQELDSLFSQGVFQESGIRNYDVFKQKYGAIVRALREKYYRADIVRQIDIATDLSEEDIKTVGKAVGAVGDQAQMDEGRKLVQMYGAMKRFITSENSPARNTYTHFSDQLEAMNKEIGEAREHVKTAHDKMHAYHHVEHLEEEKEKLESQMKALESKFDDKIKSLLNGDKFDDVYNRTITVDDILLGDLENVPENSGITPLSGFWTSEQGGDALVRNFNDIAAAIQAGGAFIKTVKTENPEQRLKFAEEGAEAVSNYNGQEGKAKFLLYTYGTDLKMSMLPFMADVLGIDKLPFDMAMTKLEKLYGPVAHNRSREQLRKDLQHLRTFMTAAADKERPEERDLPDEIREHLRHQRHHKAETMYNRLLEQVEGTTWGVMRVRVTSFLLFFFMAVFGEVFASGRKGIEAGLK